MKISCRLLVATIIMTLTLRSAGLSSSAPTKPVLVVGATGRVGRMVVQKLLAQNQPVRALVRSRSKAQEIFGTKTSLEYPALEIIKADISHYEDYQEELEQAVEGCRAIISVMGAVRFSKITDFLPWRLFNINVSSWAKRDHPYYGNYLAQKKLLELAEKHNVGRFVRLTGLGLAYPATNPFTILFNLLLSVNFRYGVLCEEAITTSKVPYVILRPGGLASDTRDVKSTNVEVEPSGELPFPGRIGREDVAELCLAACELPPDKSYTLACRWCGEGVKPKPQGLKSDGCPTANECFKQLVQSNAVSPVPPSSMKPYGVMVAIVAYSLLLGASKAALALWALATQLVKG